MKHRSSAEISERTDVERLQRQIEDRLQQQLRETDRLYTDRLCQRYRELVPPERINAIKDLPTVFEDRGQFEQSYLHATGEKPADNVVGFAGGTDEPAHVATDHTQMRKTIIHERLHQLSEPGSAERLGKRLNEGITEDLAVKELGSEWDSSLPPSYPEERALAHKLRETCGDRAVERAYFQGDVRELRSCLEGRLGEANLHGLAEMADRSAPIDHWLEKKTD